MHATLVASWTTIRLCKSVLNMSCYLLIFQGGPLNSNWYVMWCPLACMEPFASKGPLPVYHVGVPYLWWPLSCTASVGSLLRSFAVETLCPYELLVYEGPLSVVAPCLQCPLVCRSPLYVMTHFLWCWLLFLWSPCIPVWGPCLYIM